MIANREDVVQAALTVERWCKSIEDCSKCPFSGEDKFYNFVCRVRWAELWNLEEHLRTRGLKHDD